MFNLRHETYFASPGHPDCWVSESDFSKKQDDEKIKIMVITFQKWYQHDGWINLRGEKFIHKLKFLPKKPKDIVNEFHGLFISAIGLMSEVEKNIRGGFRQDLFYTRYSLRELLHILRMNNDPKNRLEDFYFETDTIKILANEPDIYNYWVNNEDLKFMMLYSRAFSIFEAFLYEFLSEKISDAPYGNSDYLKNFKKEKADKHTYHNKSTLKKLSQIFLNTDMDEIEKLYKFTKKRHDVVHRAGKNTDKEYIDLQRHEIMTAIELMENIAEKFYTQLQK